MSCVCVECGQDSQEIARLRMDLQRSITAWDKVLDSFDDLVEEAEVFLDLVKSYRGGDGAMSWSYMMERVRAFELYLSTRKVSS